MIPSILIGLSLSLTGYYEMTLIDPSGDQMGSDVVIYLPQYMTPTKPQVGKFDVIPYNIISILASIGITLFSVYLMVK